MASASLILRYATTSEPALSLLVLQLTALKPIKLVPKKDQNIPELTFIPSNHVIFGDIAIARTLAQLSQKLQPNSLYPSGGQDETESFILQSEIEQWLHFSLSLTEPSVDSLTNLNTHLQSRTFLVGYQLSLADLAVFLPLKKKETPLAKYPHLERWFKYVSSLPSLQTGGAPAAKQPAKKTGAAGAMGSYLSLEGGEMGKVVTRFPPEPSGFLHIGHAKAALLNFHYAKTYNGKLLLRFDDTNPSKEKSEYVDAILADLERMGIKGDSITYTSDHFDTILDFGRKLLESGYGYIDATPVEQMREERGAGIESKYRSNSLATNLELWEEMKKGTPRGQECVMRAKIDMQSQNKVLRDPTFYRVVADHPHLRTGDKYKAYPTYDFACPIVDSIEGVTHALRSSEYHDRNALYLWVFDKLQIRPVVIQDFSRLNFSYTLLSKRKLQWFVDSNKVTGWDDPSFPTIQGLFRRGLTLEALKEFILAQGSSKNINLMDMAKLWALNKKILDPIVPRHTVIDADSKVVLTLTNGPASFERKEVPKHKKNSSLGNKHVYYTSKVYLEGLDARSIKLNEEVTLMDWGNVIVKAIHDDSDKLTLQGELNPNGNVKDTEKKLTWLPVLDDFADAEKLVSVVLVDYNPLITKEKLAENDDFQDFVTNPIKIETLALADSNVKEIKKGATVQFERRGYYICDEALNAKNQVVMISIPDGKATGMSILSSKRAPGQK